MKWLTLFLMIELGWLPQGGFLQYERMPNGFYRYQHASLIGSFFTNIEVKALLLEHFYIVSGIKTLIFKEKGGYTFDPQSMDFKTELGLEIGMLSMFWRHHCIHPMMTYMYFYLPDLKWEGSYDEIGIRIEGKIGK